MPAELTFRQIAGVHYRSTVAHKAMMTIAAQVVAEIPISRLVIALIPAGVVLLILNSWAIGIRTSIYAIFRMLTQLLLIGYVLHYIFESDNSWIVIAVLAVMLGAASWISLRVAARRRGVLLRHALTAILVGGGSTLSIITQGVLQLDPWYLPQKMIPLAGMIFSSSMNSVSLALERCEAELRRGETFAMARKTGLEAALIPITNTLFAVGVVAIPGMMTGQVLADVPPAVAARYQIMVMCMMFGSAGISSSLFLTIAGETNLTSESPESPEQ